MTCKKDCRGSRHPGCGGGAPCDLRIRRGCRDMNWQDPCGDEADDCVCCFPPMPPQEERYRCVELSAQTEPVIYQRQLTTRMQLPAYSSLQRLCVSVGESRCVDCELAVRLYVQLDYTDRCGCCRRFRQSIRCHVEDIACSGSPGIILADDPLYQISGCCLLLQVPVEIRVG